MHFSVVIPLYNKESLIGETLQSVLAQSYHDFEVIIVNDGSNDNSLSEVIKITDPRLRTITIPNSGVSFARNVGIKNAQFEYIAFLDADDKWEPDFLLCISGIILDYPDAKVFYSGYRFSDETITTSPKDFRGYIDSYYAPENTPRICSSNVVISRQCFDKAGYFDPKLTHGEDLDMWKRLIDRYKIAKTSQILAFINNSESTHRTTSTLPDIRNKMDYYIDLKSIKDQAELEYWILHIYGNISSYWRKRRVKDVIRIMIKHKRFIIEFMQMKFIGNKKKKVN